VSATAAVDVADAPLEADRWVEGPSAWRLSLRRALSNRTLLVGLGFLLAYVGLGLAAVAEFYPNLSFLVPNYDFANQIPPPGPSWEYPFGIMGGNGVDIASALWQAVPIDLALIGGIVASALAVGTVLGAYAGLRGGWADGLVTSFSDLVVGVPSFFLIVVLFLGVEFFLPPTPAAYRIVVFAVLFALILWPYYARSVRAEARVVVRTGYVDAARLYGATDRRQLRQHVLPNSFAPALAEVPVDIFTIMFVLTVFPFLNCFNGGLFAIITPFPNPNLFPEWGALLATGACEGWSPLAGDNYWWMYTFPALVIVLFGIGVALTCDGIQRHLEPRPRTAA
jgi:peptide/nickel transport system permease protein